MSQNRLFSAINLSGLAIGMAAVLLIGLYLESELHFDSFQKNKQQIYRADFTFWQNGSELGESAQFVPTFGPAAQLQFPEIADYCRIAPDHEAYIAFQDKSFKLNSINYADSSFFRMFSFALLAGNAQDALTKPYSVVLNKTTAEKLFGTSNVIGKTVHLDGKDAYLITGVVEDAPANSTIQYSAIVSFATLYTDSTNNMGWNGGKPI